MILSQSRRAVALSYETEILLLPDLFCLFIWLLDLLDELYFHFSSFSFVRNEEFVLGVVNALIKGKIEDQWWSPLDDE